MDVVTYTGDGNSTQTITGLNFAPDLTWQRLEIKLEILRLTDSVRGVSANLSASEDTDAENADNGVECIQFERFYCQRIFFNTGGNNWVTWAWSAGANNGKTCASLLFQIAATSIALMVMERV